MLMNAFTIKDLENLSGIKAHTIRIWEKRYDFLKPKRTATNIRYYNNKQLKLILNIALLNKNGFKVSRIDNMKPQEINERILTLNDEKAINERIINELVQAMVELESKKFEHVISNYILKWGIGRAVLEIIFPFLEKIGILWVTGHVNPAQEHIVTNILRHKLISAIESTKLKTSIKKTFLLFLPEGEYHELGLLFMYYLLKSQGFSVIYLGANVPLKNAEYIIKFKKPDFTFIHLTATASNFSLEKLLHDIKPHFGKVQTIITGQLTHRYQKKIPDGIQFKKSLPEVSEFLSSLGSNR